MIEIAPLLIGLAGTLIGALPAVLVALINRGKTNAEGSSLMATAFAGLVGPQGEIIDRLKRELAEADASAEDWQKKYNKANSCGQALYYFCLDHNLIPPCTPDGVTGKLQ